MKIFIGADHNGFEMKNQLRDWLLEEGYDVEDVGAETLDETDDYPDYGIAVAQMVAKDPKKHFGIVLCGSGVGMSVAASKVPGIRGALIHDAEIARVAQRDDDINVVALGADYIGFEQAKAVITAWLTTPFAKEERFIRRIKKIEDYELSRS